jgi:hypothetical protein
MNAAKIVVGEMQGDGGPQVCQFLAERIREPRKSPHRHSHGQVLALYKTGRNLFGVGIAATDLGYNLRDSWWGVPRVRALAGSFEQFHKLCEINVGTKALGNANGVVVQSISGELHAVRKPMVQVPEKRARVGTESLAHSERGNKFGFRVNGNVDPLVPDFGGVLFADVRPLLMDERPDFIDLQIPGVQVPHLGIHQFGAALTGNEQQAHDGVPVQSGEPFRGADRTTFKKALQRPCSGIRASTHRAERRSGLRFAEGCTTGIAAPALNAALTEVPKPLAGLVLASETGHGFSPLDFCAELSHNEFGSGLWFTPRFGLALPTASTGDRAVSCYLTNWWGSRHGMPPFCIDRSALRPQGGSYLGPKSFSALDLAFRVRDSESFLSRKISFRDLSLIEERNSRRSRRKNESLFAFRILCFLDESLLFHAAQRRMDRSHGVGVTRQVHQFAKKYQSPDFHRSHCNALHHCGSYCLNKALLAAEFLKANDVLAFDLFVFTGVSQGPNRGGICGDLYFGILALFKSAFQFGKQIIHGLIERMGSWHGGT